METKKCEHHCPKCGADGNHIDWYRTDQGAGWASFDGICEVCGCEFSEIHEVKYTHTTWEN